MRDDMSSMHYYPVKYACFMGKEPVFKPGEAVEMSFQARIKAAMARKTWLAEPMLLRDKWEEKYGKDKTPSRQTFYGWFKAKPPKIAPRKLFKLGELLDVNPAWLALESDEMAKPFTPGSDLQEFLDAYRHLGPKGREALVREASNEARKLLDVQDEASIAKPYKKAPTR